MLRSDLWAHRPAAALGTGHRLGIQNAPAGGPSQLTAHIHTRRGGLLTGCDEDAPRSPRRAGIPMRGFDRSGEFDRERLTAYARARLGEAGDTVAVNTKLKNSQLNTPATALRSSALDSCAQSCSNWPWPSCAATDRTKEPRKSYPMGPRRGYPGTWVGGASTRRRTPPGQDGEEKNRRRFRSRRKGGASRVR